MGVRKGGRKGREVVGGREREGCLIFCTFRSVISLLYYSTPLYVYLGFRLGLLCCILVRHDCLQVFRIHNIFSSKDNNKWLG